MIQTVVPGPGMVKGFSSTILIAELVEVLNNILHP